MPSELYTRLKVRRHWSRQEPIQLQAEKKCFVSFKAPKPSVAAYNAFKRNSAIGKMSYSNE